MDRGDIKNSRTSLTGLSYLLPDVRRRGQSDHWFLVLFIKMEFSLISFRMTRHIFNKGSQRTTLCYASFRSAKGSSSHHCANGRSIQICQSFVKILSKHFAANKKVSLAFQQKSTAMPIMNPRPTEIVELLTFVEVTLVQYATVAGHLPGVAAAAVKAKPKKVNKVEVTHEEPSKEVVQACAVTPRARRKGPNRSAPPLSPVEDDLKTPEPKKVGKGGGKGKKGKAGRKPEKRLQTQRFPVMKKKVKHVFY